MEQELLVGRSAELLERRSAELREGRAVVGAGDQHQHRAVNASTFLSSSPPSISSLLLGTSFSYSCSLIVGLLLYMEGHLDLAWGLSRAGLVQTCGFVWRVQQVAYF